MVCPYTWDVPGGVQEHIKDLAEALIGLGHVVSVISPRLSPALRDSRRLWWRE